MIKKIRTFAVTLLLGTTVSAQTSASANLPSQETVKSFIEHLVGYVPNMKIEVARIKPAEAPGVASVTVSMGNGQGNQLLNFYVTPDGKWAFIGGSLMPFGADPFAYYRKVLAKADGPIRGPRMVKATIVEFADLECPACKAALANIEKMQAENPEVRVIFQNFPLESIHPWALRAALYVDCMKSNSAVDWKFIDTVYEHQEEINDTNADTTLKLYATSAGADANIAACIADPKTMADVKASEQLGESVSVNSTPTLFLNGRKIESFNSLPYDTFKQLVDYALNNPN
ncbi:MAG TPA: DsbA family protein [Candidatus Koribacter sp.]